MTVEWRTVWLWKETFVLVIFIYYGFDFKNIYYIFFSDIYLNARLHHLPIFLFLRYANRHLFAYTEAHAKIKRNLPFIFQNHGPR